MQYTKLQIPFLNPLGVDFSVNPTVMGTVKIAVLNDTCGNNIQLVQML